MKAWRAASLMAAVTACTAPGQYGGSIPIDHAGFLGRWRRACELGKVSSTEGSCAKVDGAPSESDESEPESSGNADDRDASDAENAPDGAGAGSDGPGAGS